jgi:hypothetical protein
MIRIYKFYSVDGHTSAFSSYPGMLSSLDDFYIMPGAAQRLVMLQTTNVGLGWGGGRHAALMSRNRWAARGCTLRHATTALVPPTCYTCGHTPI